MRLRILGAILTAAVSFLLSGIANAANGPLEQPIHVTMLYVDGQNGGNIVVAFDPGSMPGCYGDSLGYLLTSNPLFKELHAQMLAKPHRAQLAVGDDLDLVRLAHLGVRLQREKARAGDRHR